MAYRLYSRTKKIKELRESEKWILGELQDCTGVSLWQYYFQFCLICEDNCLLQARVTIQNYYQYHHVEKPGWKIGWTWAEDEVIWSMSGAFATQQGNCSAFKFQTPHSCMKTPEIVDLEMTAAQENMTEDCCHGGILSAWATTPSNSFSSFEVEVRKLGGNSYGNKPLNLTLMAPGPGYTCSPIEDADPTVSSVIGGRRQVQVFSKYSIKV